MSRRQPDERSAGEVLAELVSVCALSAGIVLGLWVLWVITR